METSRKPQQKYFPTAFPLFELSTQCIHTSLSLSNGKFLLKSYPQKKKKKLF
jgi:hypothetical protein